jgi:glycosyltransferase involved in cell wall biosynthesis
MKILFLCGSSEPGKDGVGDYTRRLCGELIRTGHQAQILSLCDKQAAEFVTQTQLTEEIAVTVRRIPLSTNYKQRLTWTQEVLREEQPDCISLQFVPYSFDPKGIPFWLPNFLNKLSGAHQWQIMFHELWIGMDIHASFKSRFFGFLQQKIVLKVLKNLEDSVINTQTNLYQQKIANLGYSATLLPLFSNIANINLIDAVAVKENFKEIRFALFGGIHFGAAVQVFIKALKLELKKSKIDFVKFIFIGNCGDAMQEWTSILDSEKIEYEVLGYCTDQEISKLLSSCDYGISTTPYLLVQKSGSIAALLEHKLPVLCVARKWEVTQFDEDKICELINISDFQKVDIHAFFNKKIDMQKVYTVSSTTDRFLEGLNKG